MSVETKDLNGYGNIPGHWNVAALPDVVFFQEGPGLRKWQWTESGMKVINVTNILGDGRIDTDNTSRFISIEEYEKTYRHFTVDAGDIVVASSGNTYGKVGRISAKDLPLMMNTSVIRFRSSDRTKLDDGFLYAFLRSEVFSNQVESFVIGSAQPNFGPTHLKRMVMPLPPLPVQQRIAGILSAYDELIENSQRRIKILEAMARALYREWFVHFCFPGHENHPRVASPLGEIPQGWEVKAVKDILARRAAGSVYRDADVKPEGDIPVIDQSAKEILGFHDNAPDHNASSALPMAIFGDHTCKMQLLIEPFSVGPNVVPFVASQEMPTAYVFHAVNSLVHTQEYKRHWIPLTAKEVVVADRVTAQRFASLIQPMLVTQETHRKAIRNLRRTRDLLLPRLLSGQIEVESL